MGSLAIAFTHFCRSSLLGLKSDSSILLGDLLKCILQADFSPNMRSTSSQELAMWLKILHIAHHAVQEDEKSEEIVGSVVICPNTKI